MVRVKTAGFQKKASAESVAKWIAKSEDRLEHPFGSCKDWLKNHPDAAKDIDDHDAFCGEVKDVLREQGKVSSSSVAVKVAGFKKAKKDWPESEDLEEGSFTKWCKDHGFEEGAGIGCAKDAWKAAEKNDDEELRGKVSYYMNTVKPEGKTLDDIVNSEEESK